MPSKRIILIAEDDDDIRESMASVLRDEGYETRTACDGREALRLLDALRGVPCVLVLDLMMPIMNGAEVLEVLSRAKRLAEVPVIVCSALPFPPSLPRGVRLFVSKPVSIDALLDGIETLCNDEAIVASSAPVSGTARAPVSEPARTRTA